MHFTTKLTAEQEQNAVGCTTTGAGNSWLQPKADSKPHIATAGRTSTKVCCKRGKRSSVLRPHRLEAHLVVGSMARGSSEMGGSGWRSVRRSATSSYSSASAGSARPRTCSAGGHAWCRSLLLHCVAAVASTELCGVPRRHRLPRPAKIERARPRSSIRPRPTLVQGSCHYQLVTL